MNGNQTTIMMNDTSGKNRAILLLVIIIFTFSGCSNNQYYVAPTGIDNGVGTIKNPFNSLQKAIDIVKSQRENGNNSYVEIFLRGGEYQISQTIIINDNISNLKISAYKNEEVIFMGGVEIPVNSAKKIVLKGNEVYKIDLNKLGIDDYGKIRNVGFARPFGPSWGELFVNGKALHLSRWPNGGMILTGEVIDPGSIPRNDDFSKRGATFRYDSVRISQWKNTGNIWISGYFNWGYADDAVQIAEIDKTEKTITTAQPTLYGFASGKDFRRWYAFNILEELDENNEFFVDREKGILYFISDEKQLNSLNFSILEKPFFEIEYVNNVTVEGIDFNYSRGLGIAINNTKNVTIKNCTFNNLGSLGITVGKGIESFTDYRHAGDGTPKAGIVGSLQQHLYANTIFNREAGKNNSIINCEFYQLGAGGVSLGGGDRITLVAGNNSVENCLFHDLNRIEKSYRPAVHLTGVGNKISHCEIYNAPSMAVLINGNNHIVEFNNIHNVCLDVDDQGAIYYGRNPSELGTIINNNYFHHIPDKHYTCAVYHDDGACGLTVTNNIFYKAGYWAVLMGGGSDNIYQNNIFIEGKHGIHIDNRLQNWGASLIKPGGIFDKRLKEVSYLNPPYSTQYPELVSYFDNPALPKRNLIENNVFLNVEQVLDGKKEWLDYKESNWETTQSQKADSLITSSSLMNFQSEVTEKITEFLRIEFRRIGIKKE